MSDLNTAMIEKYRSSFLKEVEANVEEGEWVKMCFNQQAMLLFQVFNGIGFNPFDQFIGLGH